MTQGAIQLALNEKHIDEGDLIIVTAGVPIGTTGTTNMIQVHVAGKALLEGQGLGKTSASGEVTIIRDLEDAKFFKPGNIIVASILPEELGSIASKASGLVLEEAGLTSVGAIIAVTFGIPAIVGAMNATKIIENGEEITVDPFRGKVYKGRLNLH